MNEGLTTCRVMRDLLGEFPEMTFVRGEASVYEYIERHDPGLFAEIGRLVRAGRWEIVGGSYVQPDTNLPATEPLLRQFLRGKEYFRAKFGVNVTAAWAPDSFGHSAGLPDIFAAAGIDSYAFTRPQPNALTLAKPAFWWRGASGARILAYRPGHGWYANERLTMGARLDDVLAEARASGLANVACFYGLGNHGGGPSRLHLREIREWAGRQPEIAVVHSGLHRLFASLRAEVRRQGDDLLPTVDGELNFCLRGCAASLAKFKFAYRRAQAQLLRAERAGAAAAAATGEAAPPLAEAWDTLLFNAFHDILPGSSIERAFDDQLAQTGSTFAAAQRAEHDSLVRLAEGIDTRARGWLTPADHPHPVPLLVWNPHPFPLESHFEAEVSLDYRPLWAYQNRVDDVPVAVTDAAGHALPHQIIPEEHDSLEGLPWRKRAVIPLKLPAFGWRVLQMGLPAPGAKKSATRKSPVKAVGAHGVTNGVLSVSAAPGDAAVRFRLRGRPWLAEGLQVRLYDDPWGSWGGMMEEPESFLLADERERWTVDGARVMEAGPERASLWVRLAGRRSRLDLTFLLARGARHAEVRARAFLDERSARLKLVLPAGGAADYEVPGAVVRRDPCGEVPGGSWVRAGRGPGRVGFASNALYGFDTTADEFRATIARAGRYASDRRTARDERPWVPAVDCGELRFRFLLAADTARLPELAAALEEPPVLLPVPPGPGARAAEGSLLHGLPPGVRLLALRATGRNRFEIRLQNFAAARAVTLTWLGQRITLGAVPPRKILTWTLVRASGRWTAKAVRPR